MIPLSKKQNPRNREKSKTGCRTCKRRKVKCDESWPSCRKCLKRGVICEMPPTFLHSKHNIPAKFTSAESTSNASSRFTIQDLELLHHFTTYTCATLSNSQLSSNFWAVNVPQMGFGASYVLHGVLSLAALHLARVKPWYKAFYAVQAYHHLNIALIAAVPQVSDITAENCVPLLFFGIITSFFALAQPIDDPPFNSECPLPQWFYLFRGVRSILGSQHEVLLARYDGVFKTGIETYNLWSLNEFENDILKELEGNIQARLANDAKRLSVLLSALDSLKRSFSFLNEGDYGDDDKVSAVFIWLYKIPDTYIDLLRVGDNEAMCILAFFCVLLGQLECHWWMGRWGLRLIEHVYHCLDEEHRSWVDWPLQQVGWRAI